MNFEKMYLGIELGSTRIKAVLIDAENTCVASGSYAWENKLENGIWTYEIADAIRGIRACYQELNAQVRQLCGQPLRRIAGIGISGMMHGYLVFDSQGNQLAPFRTWRNTVTGPAAEQLSRLLKFNIPQRWSVAHIYQAILNGEAHVPQIARLTPLACHIHYLLTGVHAVGVGEASGMFPYDEAAGDYDAARLAQFDALVAPCGFPWRLKELLPKICPAGECAGVLTAEGAALLDESGELEAGIPLCPPEGDAGTGMVSTGALLPRTGSISAGTSGFTMQVLEKPLRSFYPQIDVLCTPTGKTVAMVHANTCTSELNEWVSLVADLLRAVGVEPDMDSLYCALFRKAMEGAPDREGFLSYNFVASEPMVGIETGRPMTVRLPDRPMTAASFLRSQLYSAIAALRVGLDFLYEQEQVETDIFLGQGGYFKTPGVGQQILADALKAPITTMETAGEGGPWGMALLAAYMTRKAPGQTLESFLLEGVFANARQVTLKPSAEGAAGFDRWLERYKKGLDAARSASVI